MASETTTKQEEIREKLERIFGRPDLVSKAILYLHSQGVVIKVDREFCPSPYKDNCPEDVGFNHCRNIHIEAGYVAVEPLIKEGL